VAALAIDKVGPRPYHFRSGPTSGPTTWLESQKSKIFVIHSLAVLNGHPDCLKCGKTLWRPGLCPDPAGAAYSTPPKSSSWLEGLTAPPQEPHSRSRPFGPPTLALEPRSLPPHEIRLPKSAYVVNWTYFNPPPLIIPYIYCYITIVNPNTLRPSLLLWGPTCSEILAPPLQGV